MASPSLSPSPCMGVESKSESPGAESESKCESLKTPLACDSSPSYGLEYYNTAAYYLQLASSNGRRPSLDVDGPLSNQ